MLPTKEYQCYKIARGYGFHYTKYPNKPFMLSINKRELESKVAKSNLGFLVERLHRETGIPFTVSKSHQRIWLIAKQTS